MPTANPYIIARWDWRRAYDSDLDTFSFTALRGEAGHPVDGNPERDATDFNPASEFWTAVARFCSRGRDDISAEQAARELRSCSARRPMFTFPSAEHSVPGHSDTATDPRQQLRLHIWRPVLHRVPHLLHHQRQHQRQRHP